MPTQDILDSMGPDGIARFRKVFRHSPSVSVAARRLRMAERTARDVAMRLELPVADNSKIMGCHHAALDERNQKGWRESDDAAELMMARIEGRLPLQVRQHAHRQAQRYGLAAMNRRVVAEAQFAALAATERERREAMARREQERALQQQRRRKRRKQDRPDPDREIDAIVSLACTFHNVALRDVTGPSHVPQLVQVRVAISHACRALVAKASTLRIGRALNRDHSSIVNQLRKPRDPYEPFIEYCREVLS